MNISLKGASPAVSSSAQRGVSPEMLAPESDDLSLSYPAQVIIYTPNEPQVVDGTAIAGPDGDLELVIPIDPNVPVGTPVQVIIYTPLRPTVHEGRTGEVTPDGTIPVETRW
jgi:hypothetical protein